jgi:hypothetical protein
VRLSCTKLNPKEELEMNEHEIPSKSNIPSTPQDPAKSPKPRVLTDEQRARKNAQLREARQLAKVGAVTTPASKAFGEAMEAMKAKPAKSATIESVKKAGDDAMPKAGTKQAIIIKMLFRKNGASRPEVLKALDWPAINLKGLSKQYAKRFGYKASQSKESGETRYFLTKR